MSVKKYVEQRDVRKFILQDETCIYHNAR